MGEPAAHALLPSLHRLFHTAPIGALRERERERARRADFDELVAVLTAQRALPEAERAFEGDNEVLDRLLRSAPVWRGDAPPPGDATVDDIQKHLVYLLTFDRKLFAQEATVLRLLDESTHWYNAVRPAGDDDNDSGPFDYDDGYELLTTTWEARRRRLNEWRVSLSMALRTWWIDWLEARNGPLRTVDTPHHQIGRGVFRAVSEGGIEDWRELRDFVQSLLFDSAATPLAFYEMRKNGHTATECLDTTFDMAKGALVRHIRRSLEYRAGVEYANRYFSRPLEEQPDNTVLRYGLDGLVLVFRARHRRHAEVWEALANGLTIFRDMFGRGEHGPTVEEVWAAGGEFHRQRDAHLVTTTEIRDRLLAIVEELRPPPPPTDVDFPEPSWAPATAPAPAPAPAPGPGPRSWAAAVRRA